MPRRDGTGPMGMGPLTGRRAGICVGVPRRQQMGYVPYIDVFKPQVDEKEYLSKEAETLKIRLEEVDRRLKEINGESGQ